MRHAAHQSRLMTPDSSGVTQRAHVDGLLARFRMSGDTKREAEQLAILDGPVPDPPVALEYLWERFGVLNGMRHEGTHGLAPFTPESIAAANALFRWQLTPLEVDGLRLLDLAWRNPAMMDEPEDAD
jgi:hypothetical protein